MEQQHKNILFFEICRLCLEEHGHCDIFDKNDLQENIFRCIGLKVSLADSLPQKICAKCLEIVTKATELRNIAQKNDKHLKKLFHCEESETSMEICQEEEDKEEVDRDTSSEKNPAIKDFISVRKDLYDSSVSEDSVIKNEISEPKSKVFSLQNLECDKTVKCVNGITVYQCLKCPKSFNKWKKLYLHNRLHNKNYCCPIVKCGKKFSTKGDLEKHIRTHTGEKPYQCDQCDKSFAQRGTLKSHKESVHSEGTLKRSESVHSEGTLKRSESVHSEGTLKKSESVHSEGTLKRSESVHSEGTLKRSESVHSEGTLKRSESVHSEGTLSKCSSDTSL